MFERWCEKLVQLGKTNPKLRWPLVALLALLYGGLALWDKAKALGLALAALGREAAQHLKETGAELAGWRRRLYPSCRRCLPLVTTRGRAAWNAARQWCLARLRAAKTVAPVCLARVKTLGGDLAHRAVSGVGSLAEVVRADLPALRRHAPRRAMAMALTLCMALSLLPVGAIAAEGTTDVVTSACTHIHDENCGYVEAVAGSPCTHTEHDGNCGYVEAVPEVPCDKDCTDTDGDGVIDHAADCAYTPAVEGVPCKHELGEHDDTCGYIEPVAGSPCTHEHDADCGGLINTGDDTYVPPEDTECTCGAVPDADGAVVHADTCPLYETPAPAPQVCGLCGVADHTDADCPVAAVRAFLAALPAPADVAALMAKEDAADEDDTQLDQWAEQAQAAQDAYDALTEEQKALLPDAQGIFDALMAAFRGEATTLVANAITFKVSFTTGYSKVDSGPSLYDALDKAGHWSQRGQIKEIEVTSGVVTSADFRVLSGMSSLTKFGTSPNVSVPASPAKGDFPKTIQEVTISALSSIAAGAFSGCTALRRVAFPQVTAVGADAFYHCSSLAYAFFPMVSRIGNHAFMTGVVHSSTEYVFPLSPPSDVDPHAFSDAYNNDGIFKDDIAGKLTYYVPGSGAAAGAQRIAAQRLYQAVNDADPFNPLRWYGVDTGEICTCTISIGSSAVTTDVAIPAGQTQTSLTLSPEALGVTHSSEGCPASHSAYDTVTYVYTLSQGKGIASIEGDKLILKGPGTVSVDVVARYHDLQATRPSAFTFQVSVCTCQLSEPKLPSADIEIPADANEIAYPLEGYGAVLSGDCAYSGHDRLQILYSYAVKAAASGVTAAVDGSTLTVSGWTSTETAGWVTVTVTATAKTLPDSSEIGLSVSRDVKLPVTKAPACTCLVPEFDLDWLAGYAKTKTIPYGRDSITWSLEWTTDANSTWSSGCSVPSHARRPADVRYTLKDAGTTGATLTQSSDRYSWGVLTITGPGTIVVTATPTVYGKSGTPVDVTLTVVQAPEPADKITVTLNGNDSVGGQSLADAMTKAMTAGWKLSEITSMEVTAGEVTYVDWEWMEARRNEYINHEPHTDTMLTGLKDFTVSESVTSVADLSSSSSGVFPISIETITVHKVKDVGELAYLCTNLRSVSFPDATQIDGGNMGAFGRCDSLARIDLPKVQTLAADAFSGNLPALTELSLPAATSIGNRLLKNCAQIKTLYLPAVPPTVGEDAFTGCMRDRQLGFVGADGAALTGGALAAAKAAYRTDSGYNEATDTWYGWYIDGAPPLVCQCVLSDLRFPGQSLAFYGDESSKAVTLNATALLTGYADCPLEHHPQNGNTVHFRYEMKEVMPAAAADAVTLETVTPEGGGADVVTLSASTACNVVVRVTALANGLELSRDATFSFDFCKCSLGAMAFEGDDSVLFFNFNDPIVTPLSARAVLETNGCQVPGHESAQVAYTFKAGTWGNSERKIEGNVLTWKPSSSTAKYIEVTATATANGLTSEKMARFDAVQCKCTLSQMKSLPAAAIVIPAGEQSTTKQIPSIGYGPGSDELRCTDCAYPGHKDCTDPVVFTCGIQAQTPADPEVESIATLEGDQLTVTGAGTVTVFETASAGPVSVTKTAVYTVTQKTIQITAIVTTADGETTSSDASLEEALSGRTLQNITGLTLCGSVQKLLLM